MNLMIEDEQIFEAVSMLNAFARCVPFTNGQKQIYWLKLEAVRDAMNRGLAHLRLIVSRQECRTCGGTGWYDEPYFPDEPGPTPCKRCGGHYGRQTGKAYRGRGYVDLQLHEVNVANRWTFHQPHDHTTPFAGHQINWLQPHPAGTWAAEPAGRPLDWEQATALVKFLKRRYWIDQPDYVKRIYTYMNQEPVWSRW